MPDPIRETPPTSLPQERSALSMGLPSVEPRLRLWPGVIIVFIEWILLTVPGWYAPATFFQFMAMFWGPMVCAAGCVIWWLFASRLRWSDRLLVVAACIAFGVAAWFARHASFNVLALIVYGLPAVTTVWVSWLVVTRSLRWPVRRAGLLATLFVAWAALASIQLEGLDGSFHAAFAFRWQPTAEELFRAEHGAEAAKAATNSEAATTIMLGPGDWPGFRGPERDGRLTGERIATDWQQHLPRQIWRHRVGPGWSSFAVVDRLLYTQEQRGDNEAVVCYVADSGKELWSHLDPARFNEAVSGVGPRGTPEFDSGRIYALGASGRLNCLDARTGKVIWTRDIVADSGAAVPMWGFSASPLVVRDVVTVFAGGPHGKSVLGYRADNGELAWAAGDGLDSYCSTNLAHLDGVEQLLISTGAGLTAFDPVEGKVLWHFSWPLEAGMARIVQPALVDKTDVLIGTGFGNGTKRVRVSHKDDKWTSKEVWTTKAIKPYFNDLVLHESHLYGFDGNFFTCVSLEDGTGKWRTRGYGNGQVLLLAEQGLLLVLSETGEVALVEAKPGAYKELTRFQAIEGKTWNHPVVAHGKLFVRNGEEAACYDVAPAIQTSSAALLPPK